MLVTVGIVTTFAGGGGGRYRGSSDGTGTVAEFFYPAGMTVDTLGHFYVADYYNNVIRGLFELTVPLDRLPTYLPPIPVYLQQPIRHSVQLQNLLQHPAPFPH